MSDMRYRPLGSSGLMVSVVGPGANNFGRRADLDQSRAVIEVTLELGINLIDTADIYGGAYGRDRGATAHGSRVSPGSRGPGPARARWTGEATPGRSARRRRGTSRRIRRTRSGR